jgi:hypothetical protein
MKHLLASVLLLTAFPGLSWSASGPAFPIVEITAADIQTLVGIHSSQISILGFHLGMSRQKAEATLAHSETLLAFQDAWNPTRIYVYERTPAGEKGAALLYLIWDGIDESLRRITVFQGFRRYLPANFKRLLTMEAIDNTSEFKKRFIGYPNRSKVTLDGGSKMDLKHTTYYYDDIGLEITHQHFKNEEQVVFAFVIP